MLVKLNIISGHKITLESNYQKKEYLTRKPLTRIPFNPGFYDLHVRKHCKKKANANNTLLEPLQQSFWWFYKVPLVGTPGCLRGLLKDLEVHRPSLEIP